MNSLATQLCPCGSGLRTVRCCGLFPAALPPADSTRHLVPLVERAIQAHKQGAIETAERLSLDVLEMAPDQPGALSVLYQIRHAQGNLSAAEALLRRVVSFDPNNFVATNELALMPMGRGNLGEAEVHARNAIRIAPQNPQAHNLMGTIMTEAQRSRIGEYHYRQVLELSGQRDPILLANLAWNLKNQGRMEEADRQFGAAGEKLDKMDALWPNDAGVMTARAVLLGREKKNDDALGVLDAVARQNPEGRLGPNELLEKGRLLDRTGRYDEAFADFAEGKRLARELSGHQYLDRHALELTNRLKGFFVTGRLLSLPRAGVRTDVPQPVFVLGFPRSGTTPVEQTPTAHPRIAAGDELPLINDITDIMPRMLNSPLGYPEALAELWMGILTESAAWFTDKMPLNETHLGPIALLFPESLLIHVIRHPLDIMVTAMSNHFTHGFFCANAQQTAATHYMRAMDLVQYYRAEMALRYMPIRYEEMVDDQEGTVRAILDFIGEPYDRSRFRYRHYREHLGPAIERLGYSVD
jgi:Flp pilus assembly protein TadD